MNELPLPISILLLTGIVFSFLGPLLWWVCRSKPEPKPKSTEEAMFDAAERVRLQNEQMNKEWALALDEAKRIAPEAQDHSNVQISIIREYYKFL